MITLDAVNDVETEWRQSVDWRERVWEGKNARTTIIKYIIS